MGRQASSNWIKDLMDQCKHDRKFLGYYAHPDKDVMVVFCTKCQSRDEPNIHKPFITKYGRKLLDSLRSKPDPSSNSN